MNIFFRNWIFLARKARAGDRCWKITSRFYLQTQTKEDLCLCLKYGPFSFQKKELESVASITCFSLVKPRFYSDAITPSLEIKAGEIPRDWFIRIEPSNRSLSPLFFPAAFSPLWELHDTESLDGRQPWATLSCHGASGGGWGEVNGGWGVGGGGLLLSGISAQWAGEGSEH